MIGFRKEKAFTLVETIIAVLFIGIALITIASAFTNAAHILQKSRHTLRAMGGIQSYFEYTRGLPFSHTYFQDLKDGSLGVLGVGTGVPISLYMTVEEYDADNNGANDSDIRKVSIRAKWYERDKWITKNMVTLVTDNGINP